MPRDSPYAGIKKRVTKSSGYPQTSFFERLNLSYSPPQVAFECHSSQASADAPRMAASDSLSCEKTIFILFLQR